MASQIVDPKLDEFIKFLEEVSETPLLPFQKEFVRAVMSGKKIRIVQGRKGPYFEVSA